MKRLKASIGAVSIELTPGDLHEINTAMAVIKVTGDRYSFD